MTTRNVLKTLAATTLMALPTAGLATDGAAETIPFVECVVWVMEIDGISLELLGLLEKRNQTHAIKIMVRF